MIVRENVPLSELTTLRVGGPARFVVMCSSEADVQEAFLFAHAQGLPWYVLGSGSNVLASDEGYEGVIIIPALEAVSIDSGIVTAGAGVSWDVLVRRCAEEGLWGIENLAGIPGTVGAAPVQNIGAYGTEVGDTIHSLRALDSRDGTILALSNAECAFGYRESRFKHEKELVILSVAFALSRTGMPSLAYKDLAAYVEKEGALSTPAEVGDAVRVIRSRKFPDLRTHGTAGSFFKNPTISNERYAALTERYEDLPGFPNAHGIKIPLAYVLDKVLTLRGYTEGNVSLFEQQPLVLVANEDASSQEIDAFADRIKERVLDAVGIEIEREVQSLR